MYMYIVGFFTVSTFHLNSTTISYRKLYQYSAFISRKIFKCQTCISPALVECLLSADDGTTPTYGQSHNIMNVVIKGTCSQYTVPAPLASAHSASVNLSAVLDQQKRLVNRSPRPFRQKSCKSYRQKIEDIQKTKHTTGGIPRWSPTLVLVARFSAYVWQSGRDAQFSLTYGRMYQTHTYK
jgi:hypothetical protein